MAKMAILTMNVWISNAVLFFKHTKLVTLWMDMVNLMINYVNVNG